MSLSIEQVTTQWFDANALRVPDYKVGRINYNQGRSYIRIKDGQLETPFRLYTSLTTAISTCAPMEEGLLKWHCSLGYEEAKRYSRMRANYGTIMHMLIGEFIMTQTFDFEEIEEKVQAWLSEHNYWERECKEWSSDLRYDIAAFIQFYNDMQVVPLGVEYVLLGNKGYGTLIDLVCRMTIEEKGFWGDVYKTGPRAGEPKETKKEQEAVAVINFKSGRHGFYRSNGIQVECERQLWNENFPDMPATHAFNWAPKDWIKEPGYSLTDWTGDIEQAEIDAVIALADIRYAQKAINKEYVTIGGQYYSTRGLDECVKITSAEEWARKKYSDLMGPQCQNLKAG